MMITAPLLKNVPKAASFILVLFWTSLSCFGQCPTISVSNPLPICDVSGFTFADLNVFATNTGGGIVWYTSSTGGSAFNPSQLVKKGTYYAGDLSGTCSPRASIVIDFQVNPSGKNLDRIYCSNDNATVQTYIDDVLQAGIPSSGSVEVFYDFNLTNQANTTDAIPGGASNYYIVFVDGVGCKSQLEIGQVGVFSAPSDPMPASPQQFCLTSNPVVGNLNPGTAATNYKWYENVDAFGDPIQPALSVLEPLINGKTYYIQIDSFFCVSNAIPVTVTIDAPVNAGIPAILDYCNDSLPASDFNLFDELGDIKDTTGTWSGPLATTNAHLGTVNISSLTAAGSYVFTYTVPSTGICPDATATVTIRVFKTFSSGTALSPASFCESTAPSAFDLFSLLENEDPNGRWTQGASIITSPLDVSAFAPGTYNFTYTQNLAPNPCPEQATIVQINILQDPNAGNAINKIVCENDLASNSPFNLFEALDGTQDNNSGTWTDSSNVSISNTLNISGFTVAGSPYLFNYTIDNGACFDSEPITITVLPAPKSGTPVSVFPEFCEDAAPTNYNLFDLLTGEDQTGIWYIGSNNLGATTSNPVDLSTLSVGTYNFTYDVAAIGSCDDALVTVSVKINPLPNTGIPNNPPPFCENDSALNNTVFDLFTLLSGTIDLGGAWTDDSITGALTGNNLDLTMLNIGTFNFTYRITDANGCSNSTTVTLIIDDAPESGTPIAVFPEFCEGAAPTNYNLFDLLTGEDQTGTWYIGSNNLGATTSNPVDLSTLSVGTYNFTYDVAAIGSCDDALVTVSVTINPLPNTGTPTPVVYCENDLATNSPLNLFNQLSGEDVGGTWTDDNTTGALSGSDVNITALTIGSYSFTYSITDANGCSNSSTVVVTVEDAPESGTATAPLEFCLAAITPAQTVNLFDLLTGEDQTGSWNDDDTSGALSGNLVTIYGLSAGTYNFTYDVDAIGSCDDVLVTVRIIIRDIPAPTADAIQEFCDTANVSNLTATGTSIKWYDEASGGTALLGTVSLTDGETYYATQTDASTDCESSVRTLVTAVIYQSPKSGNPNPITVCSTNNTIDLFTALDGTQNSGGVWQDTDASGALSGNVFDATAVAPGIYLFTYLVNASSPCIDASTVTSVTVEAPLNAGTNAALNVCSNNGTTDLFTLLGSADLGGTWFPTMVSGTGVFDPLKDAPATYVYSLTNACGVVTSEVKVSVEQAPNAGTNNATTICMIDGPIDLFPLLGTAAQSGGTWLPTLTSGTSIFDPNSDAATTYTYTVLATAPCSPDATAQITVTVNDSPQIVVLNATPNFCLVDVPTVADLAIAIQSTGTVSWYTDATLATTVNTSDALINGEDYYATQTTGSNCESSKSIKITATINNAATPTLKDASLEYCINDSPTINDLTQNITEKNATASNVIWYDAATNGNVITNSTQLLNLETYYASLINETTGCESSVRLVVTPDLTNCGILVIPDGFSPNGDGVNDTFTVNNLELLYPNFEMEIYNRYGNMVYKGTAATPRFDGKSNQSKAVGSADLPVGVYFYIFNFNDGSTKPKQGRLYLSR